MGLKRILSLLTVTVLVGTSVVGCSSSNGGDSSGNASGDKVVVDIFQFKVEAKDALEKALNRKVDRMWIYSLYLNESIVIEK